MFVDKMHPGSRRTNNCSSSCVDDLSLRVIIEVTQLGEMNGIPKITLPAWQICWMWWRKSRQAWFGLLSQSLFVLVFAEKCTLLYPFVWLSRFTLSLRRQVFHAAFEYSYLEHSRLQRPPDNMFFEMPWQQMYTFENICHVSPWHFLI